MAKLSNEIQQSHLERFKLISSAYEVLSDSEKRLKYDQLRKSVDDEEQESKENSHREWARRREERWTYSYDGQAQKEEDPGHHHFKFRA